jgi:hypothetical protein
VLKKTVEEVPKRESLFDMSTMDGTKTSDELKLENLLKEKEFKERANEIREKLRNESSAAHSVSINSKTRGKRQSQKNWMTNIDH